MSTLNAGRGRYTHRRFIRCRRPVSTPPGATSSGSDNGKGAKRYRQALLNKARGDSKTASPKINKFRVCCILTASFGRCRIKAGSYEFGQELQVQTDKFRLDLRVDSRAGHRLMCNAHKEFIDAAIDPSEVETETDCESPVKHEELNWHCLHIDTLRSVLRAFGVKGFAGATKNDLIYVISLYNNKMKFSGIEEDRIVAEFIHNVKRQQHRCYI